MARTPERTRGSALSVGPRKPAMSREREHELAQRWRLHGDFPARDELARAQLGHVVLIARRYHRCGGASLEELVAEGNFGLVKALEGFDPERGTRLVTYAVYWIRAYISQYLLRSRSVVTAGVQSKLVSRIRRAREGILKASGDVANLNDQIAEQLAISPLKLDGLLERMASRDVPWDLETEGSPSSTVSNDAHWLSAEETALSAETRVLLCEAVAQALSRLDDRERYIVKRRLMAHRDEQLSLTEIGRHFGFSRERARQLELRALRKIKAGLVRSPPEPPLALP
ncbi:MAG TPA: sigma-70 family RNA polymerase sigma factor [Polyangiaceae bacterium]|jgi:RNA polymerase sigma-32 factor|nr:sigma-70 family RNA polymerase sigma factor [Polyangiaceae bacterium]